MRRLSIPLATLPLLGACTLAPQEDPDDWYAPPGDYDVSEPVAFTDQNYDFTGDTPIADLPVPGSFETWFAPADLPASTGCPDWLSTPELPAEISGIVTLLPRYYFKTSGCTPTPDVDSDEKYYGSYFVQDETAGYFVLGDSKVAHFDMGDRVTLRIRAIKENFEQLMILAHDVVTVERGPEAIYYERVTGLLGPEHVARVVRVEGTVATPISTFGEVYFDADDGVRFKMNLDAELTRRGIDPPVGSRIRVTGPVLFSFDEYTVVVMRVGQLEMFADTE